MKGLLLLSTAFVIGVANAEGKYSFYISNHDQSESHRVIHPIVGKTNFVYDARGAYERIRGEAIAFYVKDSENVTIRNLHIGYARPCMTEARVLGFGKGVTRVSIDEKRFPYVVKDGKLLMTGEGWTNEIVLARLFCARTGEQLAEASDIFYKGAAAVAADGMLELKLDFSGFGVGLNEGDVIAFRPAKRDFPAIVVCDSKDVVLEDVVVHDSKGMALIAQRSENVTWRGTKDAAAKTAGVYPSEGRFSSAHADASHFSNVKGLVTVENCWFDGMMDDAINVHSTCLKVLEVKGGKTMRCRYMHEQAIGFEVFKNGETLRFINGRTLENGPEMRVAVVKTISPREVEVTLEGEVPQGWGKDDAVENADYQCAVTFRNNVIRHNRARGSLFTTPKPVVIESNLFERVTGAPLLFAGDNYYWYESGACRDVKVTGNVFSNCYTSAGGYSKGILSFYPMVRNFAAQKQMYHGNIEVWDNTFIGFDAPLLYAQSVENLNWYDNRVVRNTLYRGHEQPPYVLKGCRNIRIDGRLMENTEPVAGMRNEWELKDGWEFRLEPNKDYRSVRVPHDWAIEGGFDPNGEPSAGRLPYAGDGWYRTEFTLPDSSKGQCVFLDVGGAMSHSEVFINGVSVGGRKYGFETYRVNLTAGINAPGVANRLEIHCKAPPKSARFYFGAGLYRVPRIVCTSPIHVRWNGVRIETKMKGAAAEVKADVKVVGPFSEKGVKVENCVLGENGMTIERAKLWSPETPHLYTLETKVFYNGRLSDVVQTQFGVRELRFDPKAGFFLNGVHRQMKGVCLHHDLGSLGAAFNRSAFERQVRIMKEMGADAIRTSHNPPAAEVLDVCDRMGMMVMDEAFDCWNRGKRPNDYGRDFAEWSARDITDFVERDRNHPCVVMWSIGNEIPGSLDCPRADRTAAIGRHLTRLCHKADPTRPTTEGHCRSWAMTNGMESATDVFGANYLPWDYGWYIANGKGGIIGSETCSMVSTRGEYAFPVPDDFTSAPYWNLKSGYTTNQITSYDYSSFRKHNYPPDAEFAYQEMNPACYGEFVWTGFDYLGEPDPFSNVARSSYYGIVDLCGFPKDRFYAYQAQWRKDLPMAHLLPHWTWPGREGQRTPVVCYTSGDEAELFVNGKSQGVRRRVRGEFKFLWNEVKYEPGELRVAVRKNGADWASDCVRTAGRRERVAVEVDREEVDDETLAFVTLRALDACGTLVPDDSSRVKISVGEGLELVGVGNGDATDYDSFKGDTVRLFHGQAQAILRSTSGRRSVSAGDVKLGGVR